MGTVADWEAAAQDETELLSVSAECLSMPHTLQLQAVNAMAAAMFSGTCIVANRIMQQCRELPRLALQQISAALARDLLVAACAAAVNWLIGLQAR